jgi:1,4-dihydroxy-2-naphthoate octaprenyltransferase
MGPVIVMGAYYVQLGHWGWEPFLVSLPIAFLVTAILHANNLRDIDDDRLHGKRTLATIIGRRPANWEYYLLIAGTYITLVAMVAARVAPWPVLISLATLPAAVRAVTLTARTSEPRRLNFVLFRTAQLHMRFGALLAVGLAVALVVPH